jgi:glycosyltransferase involved in cell wall biosynthesis
LDQLQEEVLKLGLSESVSFLGKVENMEVFYEGIDIFVLSSKYEGFGLVLLEAMIENIPIISSDIPTSKEVLGDEYPAFFPKGDPYNLARLLESMIDENFRSKACFAYEKRLPQFNSLRMADSISKLYQLA